MGAVATTVPAQMGTTGHGTVPATWTLMGTPSRGTPPLWGACVYACVWGRGRGICQYQRGMGVGGAR